MHAEVAVIGNVKCPLYNTKEWTDIYIVGRPIYLTV